MVECLSGGEGPMCKPQRELRKGENEGVQVCAPVCDYDSQGSQESEGVQWRGMVGEGVWNVEGGRVCPSAIAIPGGTCV